MTNKAKAIVAALMLASGLAGYAVHTERAGPRLIGHNCQGAGGDVWAADDSDFPTMCESVEVWQD